MTNQSIIKIKLFHPYDKTLCSYNVIKLRRNKFKLLDNASLNEEFTYGTILKVEASKLVEDVFIFKKIHKASGLNLKVYGIPAILTKSDLYVIEEEVRQEGGYWEMPFSGIAYSNLPKTSKLSVSSLLNSIVNKKRTILKATKKNQTQVA